MVIRLDKAVQRKILQDYGVALTRSYIFKLLEMGAVYYQDEVIKKKGFKFNSESEADKIVFDEKKVQAVIKEYRTGKMADKYAEMWHNSAPVGLFDLRKDYIDQVQVDKSDVLYEDDDVVVMYKPAGVISHPTGRDMYEDSMIYRFLKYMKDVHDFMPRAGLVHRLDRETQGLLLFAKNMHAYNTLKEQFNNNQVIKLYLVAYYIPEHPYGRARPILSKLSDNKRDVLNFKDKEFFDNVLKLDNVDVKGYISMFRFKHKAAFVHQKKELKKRIFRQIKDAHSIEFPLYKKGRVGFSILQLLTGRTHQIRAQHEYLGLFVLGDKLYSSAKIYKQAMAEVAKLLESKGNLQDNSIEHSESKVQLGRGAIGLVAYGLSFYKVADSSERVYVKLPMNKVSFSEIL